MTRDEYSRLHAVCPVCGSINYSCTFVAYIMHPGDSNFEDRNSVACSCGWKGSVHGLVEKKVGGSL